MPPLLLASSSPYRRELLARLHLPFTWASPNIDESALANETPEALVCRLAQSKARQLSGAYPQHLIIGSDQVAVTGGRILGKPHNIAKAKQQLLDVSGTSVRFVTGLALLNSQTGALQLAPIPFTVYFRELDETTIERYLLAEEPYDCAGSFKAEGLGISLFQRMEGEDPTSLIGLPLIKLVDMLAQEGINVP